MSVDQARVKELLDYDEETGIFRWKKRTSNRATIGAVAGSFRPTDGYWRIGLDNRLRAAHRLAWLYVHGIMPPADIDHINGDRTDNRICNLRLATRAENLRNMRPRGRSGLKGAHWYASRKAWTSAITKNGKSFRLGYFNTPEEAHAAYVKAARELFGEFARTT